MFGLLAVVFMFPAAVGSAPTTVEAETASGVNQEQATNRVTTPLSSAFGIALGKRFEPSMVTRVIDSQPHTLTGANGARLKGTVIQVEPQIVDDRFQNYRVKTTTDGIIYTIQAEYQFEVEPSQGKKMGQVKQAKKVRSMCKQVVKDIALELEASYGEPRGKGWDGEWFSFRKLSDSEDTSLSLYANRCRTGLYSIVISDEKMLRKIKKG